MSAYAERRAQRYRDRLASMGPAAEGKKANWPKFCRRCGADISHLPRGVRTCGACVKAETKERRR